MLRKAERALMKESAAYKQARARAMLLVDREVQHPGARAMLHRANARFLGPVHPSPGDIPMEHFDRLLKSRIRYDDSESRLWQIWGEGQRAYSSSSLTSSWNQPPTASSGASGWGLEGEPPADVSSIDRLVTMAVDADSSNRATSWPSARESRSRWALSR